MNNEKLLWWSNWENLLLVSNYIFDGTPNIPQTIGPGQFRVYFFMLKGVYDFKTLKSAVESACKFANIDKNDKSRKYPIVFVNELDNEDRKIIVRSADFMNSSIWNYFWDPKATDAPEQIRWILTEIQKNYKEGRYDLAVAQEYAEFNYRLLLNSYLSDYDDDDSHAAAVSPFLFHSERNMESWVNEVNEKDKAKHELLTHSLNWRLLLVDDHPNGQTPMKSTQGLEIGKLEIIKDNLKRININIFEQPSNIAKDDKRIVFPYIEFDYAKTVDDAYAKIKESKYDIILLDYKLAKLKDDQKYGYELLQKIKEDQEREAPELAPGPNNTYYFMFISAYTTAVQERLQKEGFYLNKDYWFIGRGACPTNTPYLFLYCLKRMMDVRYDKLTKHSKQLLKDLSKQNNYLSDKDIETGKRKYATMTMFLTKLYEKGNERNNCVIGFNAFLNLRRVYDAIKHDVDHTESSDSDMKSSPLIMSLFKDERFCSNSFWEHLQNLVYLTAFGTIRQWPEMWEDYIFIKTKLEKAENVIWDELSMEEQKNIKPSLLIRNYILSLKGMMS